jgi:hypothetical protein
MKDTTYINKQLLRLQGCGAGILGVVFVSKFIGYIESAVFIAGALIFFMGIFLRVFYLNNKHLGLELQKSSGSKR